MEFSRQEYWSGLPFPSPMQFQKVKSEREVTQSCPTLLDPMDCSLPGSSIHGIFQAKVLEWGAIAFSEFTFRTDLFRTDWFDLLAVQGTFKSLLQHHSSKAPILWCSDFFMVQLSHPYMTIGRTIALTRWTFVSKVMSVFFNMLSRLVMTFLPRSKRLLISWLQSPSAVILEPKKIKSATVSIVFPSTCYEVMGLDAMTLVF